MADNQRKAMMSVVVTSNSRLADLPISNESQLIFLTDKSLIGLDFFGKRYFYRSIVTLETDEDRQTLEEPVNGTNYFVKDTCILWTYDNDEWIKITCNTDETVYIGIDKPAVGVEGVLYVNKADKDINVWDNETNKYICVGEKNEYASVEDIKKMFN